MFAIVRKTMLSLAAVGLVAAGAFVGGCDQEEPDETFVAPKNGAQEKEMKRQLIDQNIESGQQTILNQSVK